MWLPNGNETYSSYPAVSGFRQCSHISSREAVGRGGKICRLFGPVHVKMNCVTLGRKRQEQHGCWGGDACLWRWQGSGLQFTNKLLGSDPASANNKNRKLWVHWVLRSPTAVHQISAFMRMAPRWPLPELGPGSALSQDRLFSRIHQKTCFRFARDLLALGLACLKGKCSGRHLKSPCPWARLFVCRGWQRQRELSPFGVARSCLPVCVHLHWENKEKEKWSTAAETLSCSWFGCRG